MQYVKAIVMILAIVSALLFVAFDEPDKINENKPIALLELFTSQGCSSCPSADRLMRETVEKAEAQGKAVIGLSFHVSYWNYLGWKDPYSSAEWNKRQEMYARNFNLNAKYTPQVVVNGFDEFTGSNRQKMESSIKKALAKPAKAVLEVDAGPVKEGHISLNYKVLGTSRPLVVNIALVEKYVENNVPRGENRGKILKHNNVVRSLTVVDRTDANDIKMAVPKGFKTNNGFLVAYAQDANSLEVLGAVKVML